MESKRPRPPPGYFAGMQAGSASRDTGRSKSTAPTGKKKKAPAPRRQLARSRSPRDKRKRQAGRKVTRSKSPKKVASPPVVADQSLTNVSVSDVDSGGEEINSPHADQEIHDEPEAKVRESGDHASVDFYAPTVQLTATPTVVDDAPRPMEDSGLEELKANFEHWQKLAVETVAEVEALERKADPLTPGGSKRKRNPAEKPLPAVMEETALVPDQSMTPEDQKRLLQADIEHFQKQYAEAQAKLDTLKAQLETTDEPPVDEPPAKKKKPSKARKPPAAVVMPGGAGAGAGAGVGMQVHCFRELDEAVKAVTGYGVYSSDADIAAIKHEMRNPVAGERHPQLVTENKGVLQGIPPYENLYSRRQVLDEVTQEHKEIALLSLAAGVIPYLTREVTKAQENALAESELKSAERKDKPADSVGGILMEIDPVPGTSSPPMVKAGEAYQQQLADWAGDAKYTIGTWNHLEHKIELAKKRQSALAQWLGEATYTDDTWEHLRLRLQEHETLKQVAETQQAALNKGGETDRQLEVCLKGTKELEQKLQECQAELATSKRKREALKKRNAEGSAALDASRAHEADLDNELKALKVDHAKLLGNNTALHLWATRASSRVEELEKKLEELKVDPGSEALKEENKHLLSQIEAMIKDQFHVPMDAKGYPLGIVDRVKPADEKVAPDAPPEPFGRDDGKAAWTLVQRLLRFANSSLIDVKVLLDDMETQRSDAERACDEFFNDWKTRSQPVWNTFMKNLQGVELGTLSLGQRYALNLVREMADQFTREVSTNQTFTVVAYNAFRNKATRLGTFGNQVRGEISKLSAMASEIHRDVVTESTKAGVMIPGARLFTENPFAAYKQDPKPFVTPPSMFAPLSPTVVTHKDGKVTVKQGMVPLLSGASMVGMISEFFKLLWDAESRAKAAHLPSIMVPPSVPFHVPAEPIPSFADTSSDKPAGINPFRPMPDPAKLVPPPRAPDVDPTHYQFSPAELKARERKVPGILPAVVPPVAPAPLLRPAAPVVSDLTKRLHAYEQRHAADKQRLQDIKEKFNEQLANASEHLKNMQNRFILADARLYTLVEFLGLGVGSSREEPPITVPGLTGLFSTSSQSLALKQKLATMNQEAAADMERKLPCLLHHSTVLTKETQRSSLTPFHNILPEDRAGFSGKIVATIDALSTYQTPLYSVPDRAFVHQQDLKEEAHAIGELQTERENLEEEQTDLGELLEDDEKAFTKELLLNPLYSHGELEELEETKPKRCSTADEFSQLYSACLARASMEAFSEMNPSALELEDRIPWSDVAASVHELQAGVLDVAQWVQEAERFVSKPTTVIEPDTCYHLVSSLASLVNTERLVRYNKEEKDSGMSLYAGLVTVLSRYGLGAAVPDGDSLMEAETKRIEHIAAQLEELNEALSKPVRRDTFVVAKALSLCGTLTTESLWESFIRTTMENPSPRTSVLTNLAVAQVLWSECRSAAFYKDNPWYLELAKALKDSRALTVSLVCNNPLESKNDNKNLSALYAVLTNRFIHWLRQTQGLTSQLDVKYKGDDGQQVEFIYAPLYHRSERGVKTMTARTLSPSVTHAFEGASYEVMAGMVGFIETFMMVAHRNVTLMVIPAPDGRVFLPTAEMVHAFPGGLFSDTEPELARMTGIFNIKVFRSEEAATNVMAFPQGVLTLVAVCGRSSQEIKAQIQAFVSQPWYLQRVSGQQALRFIALGAPGVDVAQPTTAEVQALAGASAFGLDVPEGAGSHYTWEQLAQFTLWARMLSLSPHPTAGANWSSDQIHRALQALVQRMDRTAKPNVSSEKSFYMDSSEQPLSLPAVLVK